METTYVKIKTLSAQMDWLLGILIPKGIESCKKQFGILGFSLHSFGSLGYSIFIEKRDSVVTQFVTFCSQYVTVTGCRDLF